MDKHNEQMVKLESDGWINCRPRRGWNVGSIGSVSGIDLLVGAKIRRLKEFTMGQKYVPAYHPGRKQILLRPHPKGFGISGVGRMNAVTSDQPGKTWFEATLGLNGRRDRVHFVGYEYLGKDTWVFQLPHEFGEVAPDLGSAA